MEPGPEAERDAGRDAGYDTDALTRRASKRGRPTQPAPQIHVWREEHTHGPAEKHLAAPFAPRPRYSSKVAIRDGKKRLFNPACDSSGLLLRLQDQAVHARIHIYTHIDDIGIPRRNQHFG